MINLTKVWIFLLTFSLLPITLGYQWSGRLGLFAGLFISILLIIIVSQYTGKVLKQSVQANRLRGQDPWNVTEICEELSDKLSFQCPEVWMTQGPEFMALVDAPSPIRPRIYISEKHFGLLSTDEKKCFLGLMISQCYLLQQWWPGIPLLMLISIYETILKFEKRLKLKVLSKALHLVFTIIALALVNRRFFYEVDNLSLQLCGSRTLISKTIWKAYSYQMSDGEPIADFSVFGFHNLTRPKLKLNWLSFHPSLRRRTYKLIGNELI